MMGEGPGMTERQPEVSLMRRRLAAAGVAAGAEFHVCLSLWSSVDSGAACWCCAC